ncbi:NUDIX hydrolase [Nocardioides dongkuii]|uniref:NUDIX hydrolase n=1 Tax=Nocardioides dongkuii TaxID=2760089 RepID=UPI00187796A7|nr:NUDIX domain-containing protein [Nocardioides dongkuii]
MTGSLHADALALLRSWVPPSPEQAALRDRYVDHLRGRPDGMARSCAPEHVTASVLVLDEARTQLLLTHHAKSGRWFQLGGHTEPADATLAGAALREAVEESGIGEADLDLDPVPALLDAHHVPFCGDGGVWHLDVMFRAVARVGAAHSVSEESLDVRWWPLDSLPNPELVPFAALALARDQSTGSLSMVDPGGGASSAAADQPSR